MWDHRMLLLAPYEKSKFLGSGGSMVARLKIKGIDGRVPPCATGLTIDIVIFGHSS